MQTMAEFRRDWKWWLKCLFACYAGALALFLVQLVLWFPLRQYWEQAPFPFDVALWLVPFNMLIAFPLMFKRLN